MASNLDATDVERERVLLYWGMDYYTVNSRCIEVSGSAWPSLFGYTLALVDRLDAAVVYTTCTAVVTGADTIQVLRLELSASDLLTWGRGRHIVRVKGTKSSRDILLSELILDVI